MNRVFSPAELLKIAQSQDIRLLTQADRAVTLSLFKTSSEDHPDALKICYLLSRIELDGDQFLNSLETAHIIIEEILDPEKYLEEALKLLEEETLESKLKSPLWLFLGRGEYAKTQAFRDSIISYFPENPAFFSEVMDKTREAHYLATLEACLKQYAPFVKYLPLEEDSHEFFWPHDIWLRVGSSYVRLLQGHSKIQVKRVPDFLEQKFFSQIPDDIEDWKKATDKKEVEDFELASGIYIRHIKGH